jgi:excisionase family DNA binding protein
MATDTKEVLNLNALTGYLEVSKSTLYKLAPRGGIPGQKVGKQWRFHKVAIEEWLQRHPARLSTVTGRQAGNTRKGKAR